jgi:hypothetical protein
MMTILDAGVAEIEITPPANGPMDGYLARDGESEGSHDPLLAQILILKQGEACAAVVTPDVLAVSADWAAPLRQTLAQLLDTSPAAILICPSHTHCGPLGLQTWFPLGDSPPLDVKLAQWVQARLVQAAQTAAARLRPVRLDWAQGELHGLGGDRNQPNARLDSRLTVFRLQPDDDQPMVILFHYACHPTVLGADTRLYSADFPGAARARLREVYPQAISLYLNGASGDISPRFHRRDQSFDEVNRLGSLLAERVVELLQTAQPLEGEKIGWRNFDLQLPFRSLDLMSPVISSHTGRRAQTQAQGVALQSRMQAALAGRAGHTIQLAQLQIGACSLFGIPGEPFNALATALRRVSPLALVVGLANDYAGYFPTQAAIDAQTYEALSSPYDARALHLIEEKLLEQLGY